LPSEFPGPARAALRHRVCQRKGVLLDVRQAASPLGWAPLTDMKYRQRLRTRLPALGKHVLTGSLLGPGSETRRTKGDKTEEADMATRLRRLSTFHHSASSSSAHTRRRP